ncbi:MAG: dihydrofolate reductase family protein, partial [Ktedonobacteraceae bacterium]|nr:dihydrofolate reductase family protein [Ktedonobacteraceae bacterium]
PIVVVTHRPPPEWVKQEWPITFVHDGVESAITQARAIAGEKTVAVASTTIVQQCLKTGLLDEIHIDLVPFLLGSGIRLFDHLDAPIELESTSVIASTGVTHLTFRVLK